MEQDLRVLDFHPYKGGEMGGPTAPSGLVRGFPMDHEAMVTCVSSGSDTQWPRHSWLPPGKSKKVRKRLLPAKDEPKKCLWWDGPGSPELVRVPDTYVFSVVRVIQGSGLSHHGCESVSPPRMQAPGGQVIVVFSFVPLTLTDVNFLPSFHLTLGAGGSGGVHKAPVTG